MMTTFAAIAGALPLAVALRRRHRVRRPLGISIVGGLIVSQMLTLYTTPVMYLVVHRYWKRRKLKTPLSPERGAGQGSLDGGFGPGPAAAGT